MGDKITELTVEIKSSFSQAYLAVVTLLQEDAKGYVSLEKEYADELRQMLIDIKKLESKI